LQIFFKKSAILFGKRLFCVSEPFLARKTGAAIEFMANVSGAYVIGLILTLATMLILNHYFLGL